jgi:hypothetical protein
VYHPQPAPKVLQLKTAVGRQSQAGQPPHQPVKLPAYTPQPAPVLLKGFGASRQSVAGKVGRAPQAFPAYGRDSTTKIVGTKSAAAPSGSVIQGAFRGRAQLVGGERLERVSTASSAHWAEDFKSNYKNVANHQYGFSIASRQQNEDDATEINAFIDAVNGDKAWADPYQFITYDDQVEPPKIRYNVHGSVYSTHADHTQLYPLYGAGIDRGRGAGDAAKLLKKRGELTDKRMCILGQLYRAQRQGQWGSEVRAFAMLSNNERALYKRVCEEEALTSAPSSLADYLPGGISL